MNTNKLMYWLALGVFALGMHSEYRNGRFPVIHRLADRGESTFCRLVTRAEQTVALARVLTDRQVPAADDLLAGARDQEMAQAELLRDRARAHAELVREQVRAQADLIRAGAELQRSQIEQIRWRTQSQFKMMKAESRRITLICPKTGARISVDAVPTDIGPSDIEVDNNF